MAKTIDIRPLAWDDDRSGFSCGQTDLDRFFEHYAGQNQFKVISETKHPRQAGGIKMSHLGSVGFRSNLASIGRMAFLDIEMPFR